MNRAHRTTLLELVFAIQRIVDSDDEVVAIVTHLINNGRVELCGSFAGQRIRSKH